MKNEMIKISLEFFSSKMVTALVYSFSSQITWKRRLTFPDGNSLGVVLSSPPLARHGAHHVLGSPLPCPSRPLGSAADPAGRHGRSRSYHRRPAEGHLQGHLDPPGRDPSLDGCCNHRGVGNLLVRPGLVGSGNPHVHHLYKKKGGGNIY